MSSHSLDTDFYHDIDLPQAGAISYAANSSLAPSVRGGRRYLILLVTILLNLAAITLVLLSASGHPAAATDDHPEHKLDQALLEALTVARQGDQLRVVVHMRSTTQADFSGLPENMQERRAAVVERLQETAAVSQAAIQLQLQQEASRGAVSFYRSLWIINGIQLAASPSTIHALASRSDVDQINLDTSIQFLSPMTPTIQSSQVSAASFYEPGWDKLWHIERIRAEHVWAGLDISGTNVIVAIMDTGVDWLHPALVNTYIGVPDGGPPDHSHAWFDAVAGSPEPIDPNGHGTHVMGTAVGRLGIGAAPGSRWMAVRILDANGTGYIGDIHAGFQWLLAPGGDPSRAPDIVNGSWSGPPELVDFTQDVQALQAAGILTVFAAGNSGPFEGSVRAPANYPGVIAVGATDDSENVAWFSSRGPSSLTSEVKPTISAPGMHILSSLPGDNYGFFNGTSMASPIVTGIYALLLSAGADPATATTALTTSASPIGAPQPNNDSGWGRADAYAAVAAIATTGRVFGTVNGGGVPLTGAVISVTTPGGTDLSFRSSDGGLFSAKLISGTYGLSVSAYGYETYLVPAFAVKAEAETSLNVDLLRLPFGEVQGRLFDKASGNPLSGTVTVSGTPVSALAGDDGHYSLELPTGDYEVVASSEGHRLGRKQVTVVSSQISLLDLDLDSGPRILLVDSGSWYGSGHLDAYEQALRQSDFAIATLEIRDPYNDVPTAESLSSFDTVVWSAPLDSPGYIGAGEPLSTFLDEGGNLLIGGQNIAAYDGASFIPEKWWSQVGGIFVGKAQAPFNLKGVSGSPFEGIQVQLSDVDASGEPVQPDITAPANGSLAEIGITYDSELGASLLTGICEPFRVSYLGFGLENIPDEVTQANLVTAAFTYFDQPEIETGLSFERPAIDDLVAPGSMQVYEIPLLNMSETLTDTFTLELVNSGWKSKVITQTLVVGPCETGLSEIEVEVPADLPRDTVEQFGLVATSSNNPAYQQTLDFRLKTPGQILLVDDDRWYDQSSTFRNAMSDAGILFDFWEIEQTGKIPKSPSAALLQAYNFVFWYTGYDWFRPITKLESEMLADFVQQGGRLFLTSQDYMYYHPNDRLTRDYLGVMHYVESITPTLAYGGDPLTPFYDLGGPHELQFGPYQNHADGLIPAAGNIVSLWDERGYASGIASTGTDWRTVFWAIPFETLPKSVQARAMNRIVGWLGDLGETTFVVDNRSGPASATRTYTLTLRYSPAGPGTNVHVTNTVPLTMNVNVHSISGGAQYEHSAGQITWSGHMDPGQEHVISYEASLPRVMAPGGLAVNLVSIYYDDHHLGFQREAKTWVDLPDMTLSRVNVSQSLIEPGQLFTVELRLVNGNSASGYVTASLPLPAGLVRLSETFDATSGEVQMKSDLFVWRGFVDRHQEITATIVLTAPMSLSRDWIPLTARIEDGISTPVIVSTVLDYQPYTWYQPLLFHQ